MKYRFYENADKNAREYLAFSHFRARNGIHGKSHIAFGLLGRASEGCIVLI